jgi:hypothetical protein
LQNGSISRYGETGTKKGRKMIRTMLWLLTIAGSLFGGFIGVVGVFAAKGAPQEASAAAMAVACAAIPYCLARAVSEIWEQNFS